MLWPRATHLLWSVFIFCFICANVYKVIANVWNQSRMYVKAIQCIRKSIKIINRSRSIHHMFISVVISYKKSVGLKSHLEYLHISNSCRDIILQSVLHRLNMSIWLKRNIFLKKLLLISSLTNIHPMLNIRKCLHCVWVHNVDTGDHSALKCPDDYKKLNSLIIKDVKINELSLLTCSIIYEFNIVSKVWISLLFLQWQGLYNVFCHTSSFKHTSGRNKV